MAAFAQQDRNQGKAQGKTALDWRKYRLATEADSGEITFHDSSVTHESSLTCQCRERAGPENGQSCIS